MPYETDAPNASGSSPVATQADSNLPAESPASVEATPKPILPGSFPPRPSFMAFTDKPKPGEAKASDASPASGSIAQEVSADPADYSPADAADAADAAEPAAAPADGDPYSADAIAKLPYNQDKRFQQFLADRKADQVARQELEAQKAEVARLRAFAPLVDDLTKQGYADYGALQAQIQEQARQAEAERQQAEDAAYQQQLQQTAEQRFVDEEDKALFVEMQMESRLARREAEEARRMAQESKQHYEATLAQQEEGRRFAAYQEVLASDPVFTAYGKDPATGKGLVEDLLADYVNQGADPNTLRGIAGNIASRLKAQRDADIAAAKAEAAKGMKKSAGAPAALGTRGTAGGRAPAAGEVATGQPNNGFRPPNLFTRWTDKRHL